MGRTRMKSGRARPSGGLAPRRDVGSAGGRQKRAQAAILPSRRSVSRRSGGAVTERDNGEDGRLLSSEKMEAVMRLRALFSHRQAAKTRMEDRPPALAKRQPPWG